MKQYIKSYHLFLTRWWFRGIIYLVYPTLLLLLAGYFGSKVADFTYWSNEENYKHFTLLLLHTLWDLTVSVEIFGDYFIMGGIAAKDTNKLEYLKTSIKGIPVLTKALTADGIRRLLSIAIIAGIGSPFCRPDLNVVSGIAISLTIFCFTEAGLIVTRHFPSMLVNCITASVIMTFMTACINLLLKTPVMVQIMLPLLLAIIISFLGRWLILKKARNSYYDNRPENSL